MHLKEIQKRYLDDLQEAAELSTEQADWLMKEHVKNQGRIDKLYDDEISQQRMMLEEKLAKRRMLAEKAVSIYKLYQ